MQKLVAVETSYNRNKLRELAESGISVRVVVLTAGVGLPAGFMLPPLVGISDPAQHGVFAIALIAVTFFVAMKICASRNYDMEGLDQVLIRIKSFFNRQPINLEAKPLQPRTVENEKRLYTPLGVEVLVFRVKPESPQIFVLKVESLIRYAVDGVTIRFYRAAEKVELKRDLPVDIYSGQLYVSVEITGSMGDSEQIRTEILQHMEGAAQRLNDQEIQELCRNLVAPTRDIAPWELTDGIFPSPIVAMHRAALLHFGDAEDRGLVLSMGRMPKKVGPNLQRLFSVLSRRPGVICVTVTGQPPKNPLGEQYRRKLTAEDTGVDVKNLRKEQGTDANVRINMHCIVHGTKKQTAAIRRELDREYAMLPADERPFFTPDGAYAEEILKSILPGARNHLPVRRRFEVVDRREAASYVPWTVDAGDENGAVLEMRTIENFLFHLKLYFDAPLYVWGRAGSGKSLMLSTILLNFIDNARVSKKRVGVYVMESGGTQAFMRERVDLSITLDQDAAGRWQPLSFRILEYFFSLEDKGVEAAKGWLHVILNVELTEVLSEIGRILLCMRDAGETRLRDLYARLESYRSGLEPGEVKTALNKHMMILRNYCLLPQSQYGHIFDPEEVKPHAYQDVWSIYVSQTPAPKQESELTTSFYNLGLGVYNAFESRFVPTPGKESAVLLAEFDELANLFKHKALTRRQIRDVNTQGRKEGKVIVMSSQELADLVGDGEDLVGTFGHFLAADAGPVDLIARTLQSLSDERKVIVLNAIEDALMEVNSVRMRKLGFSWLYIGDPKRTSDIARVVMLDLTKTELWRTASDFPARRLRSLIQSRFSMSHDQASLMLSLYGPGKPPREDDADITNEELEVIYERIEQHQG